MGDDADVQRSLLHLAELNERRDLSWRAMTLVNGLRLEAVYRQKRDSMLLSVLTYDESLSLRNMVLCGEVQSSWHPGPVLHLGVVGALLGHTSRTWRRLTP